VLLPNAARAEIAPEKLHGYLLSEVHPVGRFKARFFKALGFSADQWQELEHALRVQHLTHDAEQVPPNPDGQTYTIRSTLVGPNGQSAVVISVWFIPAGRDVAHFVTAYPGGSS
jgi:hypothetical protein